MRDIVWVAVIGIALACIAVVAGVLDLFLHANLSTFTLGTGLASVTFGLLGVADRFDPHSDR